MGDWLRMTASELGRGVGDGSIDPVELAQAHLDAIDGHPERDRVYAVVTERRALAEAEAARGRAAAGTRRGPLDGVPVSWKDLFDTAGTPTEAGSALLKGRVPERDARTLRLATMAGLVCLGKTHMSELAFSGLGLNPVTATPPCVNDREAVAGGSSSGAAASVALGMAALAIGSDTGGSVRIPAAWNDLVGLKTTSGRISLEGVVPLCARFDTVGPLARSVEDCAHALAALEGGAAADLRGASLQGVRLAELETVALEDVRDAPARAHSEAVGRLVAAGAVVERLAAPEVAEAIELSGTLFSVEAYGTWGEAIEAAPEKMFAPIRERFRGGRDVPGERYVAAWQKLDELRALWSRRMAGWDGAIMPSSPILPPNAQRLLADEEYYAEENLLALRNTRIGNLMGLCAVTLPAGTPSCGVMICGRPGDEERLLRIAAAAEAALGAA